MNHSSPKSLMRCNAITLWILLVQVSTGFSRETIDTEASPAFERDVRPILKAMCFQCHGEEEELHGGLDLRLTRLIKTGGDSGESIVPGKAEESLLWKRIESDEMPEGTKKLSTAQKKLIREWIEAGCKTLRAEPENVEDARYTPEELSFWAFQPIVSPEIPRVDGYEIKNPIDAFTAEQLVKSGLPFSNEASRAVLLRRLSMNLTGLPPSLDELKNFTNDSNADAYEKVVERLLESPQYGARWGRHWLDVAGYAETEGNMGEDTDRPQAWRYRDYVIRSFNKDTPYDVFLQEQIAGDELVGGKPDPENERHVELLTATAFLQMAPNLTAKTDSLVDKNQAVAETLKVVSAATMGLTVGCAQCHDHRYDPISAEDYYRFRAIFDPAFPMVPWSRPQARLVDMTPKADRDISDGIESKAAEQEADLKRRRSEFAKTILEKLLKEIPEEIRLSLVEATAKPEDKRSEAEKSLLVKNPMIKDLEFLGEHILLYDGPQFRIFEKEEKEIAALRDTKPSARKIMCVTESKKIVPESAVLFRGDPMQRRKVVTPSEIFIAARGRSQIPNPTLAESRPSTGRRLAYAQQLTDGTHPLTARVAVNRFWMHHFGKGLVGTAGDFGLFGERPTHPKLLDFLAAQFMKNGWRMKDLHKTIVMSHTYRQASHRTAQSDAIDPDNLLLSRMNMLRMDAESIRDSILAVTQLLNPEMGGQSVPVAVDEAGKSVIGKLKTRDGLFAGIDDVGEQKYRRSIFIQVQRSSPLNMLDTFDLPAMTPNCDSRKCSTVAPQSLWFLNDPFLVEVTDRLAEKMFSGELPNVEARVRDLFLRLYGQEPTSDELRVCGDYLTQQSERFRNDPKPEWQKVLSESPHAADLRAHATLCQALICTNRFLYVE